jgi:hypothetical protein
MVQSVAVTQFSVRGQRSVQELLRSGNCGQISGEVGEVELESSIPFADPNISGPGIKGFCRLILITFQISPIMMASYLLPNSFTNLGSQSIGFGLPILISEKSGCAGFKR